MGVIIPFLMPSVDLEMIKLSEVRQRKTNIIWYHLYGNLKYDTNELIYKTEIDSDTENKLMVAKGEMGGE